MAEGLEIKPLAGLSTTETGTLLEHTFSAIAIAPAGLKSHRPVLIERAAILAIQHFQAEPLSVAAAFLQSLATIRSRLAGFGMGAQQMLNRLWIPGREGESAKETLENPSHPRENNRVIAGAHRGDGQQAARIR